MPCLRSMGRSFREQPEFGMEKKRRVVSLLIASTFLVLAVTGIIAFIRPFSIQIVGLHALIGFLFTGLIALHIANNSKHLSRYLKSKAVWLTSGFTIAATVLFFLQPSPVKRILGLSGNLGPALERFEMSGEALSFHYSPDPHYKMALSIRTGEAFDLEEPPQVAIWLENASFYHIKTLLPPQEIDSGRAALPYWDFKVRGWEKAKREAAEKESKEDAMDDAGLDAISAPTRNSSFDPADYITAPDSDTPMPYRLLVEIDQPNDGQPSLVYSVEIDNADPRAYQLLDLTGYPKREEDDEDSKEVWELYYIGESFDSALELIDSALLTIDRKLDTGGEREPDLR